MLLYLDKREIFLSASPYRLDLLLPLGRGSLLSELAGRGDRLINMHIEHL